MRILIFMPPPQSGEGHIVYILVSTYFHPSFGPSHFVVVFLPPQLLLQFSMQGFETCSTVQTCIEHVHKGNRILIQVIIAELYPLEWHILIISHSNTVPVSTTPPTVFDAGI